mgnify:FL=1
MTNGQIAEVILYDRVLDNTEREMIEAYLAQKYGLSHPNAGKDTTLPGGPGEDLPPVQLTGLVKGAKYYYRFHAENTPEGGGDKQVDWADSTATFTAEKVLNFETGTLTFNTDDASWSHSSGATGKGEVVEQT